VNPPDASVVDVGDNVAENSARMNAPVGNASVTSLLSVANLPAENHPSANDNLTEETECVICFAAPKDTMLLHADQGAGHTCVCFGCAQQLKESHSSCPICRSPIDAVIRNYIA